MSEATFDSLESENYDSAESPYEGEAQYDSVGDSASDYAEDVRRRSRQRRIVDARRYGGQLRAPQPPPPPRRVTVRSQAARPVRAEVRSLDLDTQAMINSLHQRLDAANQAATRNAWASEASAAASQILDSFDTGLAEHDWARAVIRGAPTLLLVPGERRRPGLEGWLLDPRVAGGAVLAAIWAVGHFRDTSTGVHSVSLQPGPDTLTVAAGAAHTALVSAAALDKAGNTVTGAKYVFQAQPPGFFDISEDGGIATLTGRVAGTAFLSVTADGKSNGTWVTVS